MSIENEYYRKITGVYMLNQGRFVLADTVGMVQSDGLVFVNINNQDVCYIDYKGRYLHIEVLPWVSGGKVAFCSMISPMNTTFEKLKHLAELGQVTVVNSLRPTVR